MPKPFDGEQELDLSSADHFQIEEDEQSKQKEDLQQGSYSKRNSIFIISSAQLFLFDLETISTFQF